jgi:hypothetical protein
MVIALTIGKELDTATVGLADWMTVLHSSTTKSPRSVETEEAKGGGVSEKRPG